jgi:alanyl-tRNA synthetase
MGKKLQLKEIGKTTNGDLVICGESVFKFVDSKGLPLEFILEDFKEKNYVIDWLSFYNKCISVGWNKQTTLLRIQHAIGDVYGNTYKNHIMNLLNV